MRTVRIPLHSRKYPGLYAIVDEVDAELVSQHRWFPVRRKTGWHAQTVVKASGKRQWVYLHQLILDCDSSQQADHIDCDGLNNTRRNLRPASQQNNNRNQRRRSDNRSGFKGVSWNRQKGRWRAVIMVDGKQHHLGHFDDPEDAACAYDEAARLMFGGFARLNFPQAEEQQA